MRSRSGLVVIASSGSSENRLGLLDLMLGGPAQGAVLECLPAAWRPAVGAESVLRAPGVLSRSDGKARAADRSARCYHWWPHDFRRLSRAGRTVAAGADDRGP